jgi:uncharacterized protein
VLDLGCNITAPGRTSIAPVQRQWRTTPRQSGQPPPLYAGALCQITPSLPSLPIPGTFSCVNYEWDNGKAAANRRKHGVDFADAIAALEDANRVEEIDARFVRDEERIQVIGMAQGKVLFVIVTIPGEDTCRIISARKATRHEQERYYTGNFETW